MELLEAGVRVKTGSEKSIHQKTWLIDQAYAYVGSGNATVRSRTRCSEFGIETNEPLVIQKLKDKLDRLWELGLVIDYETARRVRGHQSRVRHDC